MSAPGIIVAAHKSGAGKTTVTLALLAALKRRGRRVHPAKTGPDYIDPVFHERAAGRGSINLDSWAMPPGLLDALMADVSADADIAVIEASWGCSTGLPVRPGRSGATADLAARFGLPVILVIDVTSQAQSAAALLRGFATHDPAVQIAGVILNRVASERHARLIAPAIEALRIPVLGMLPRDKTVALPKRHLGLVQAGEHDDLEARFDALADLAETHLDLEAISALARPPLLQGEPVSGRLPPPGLRIAVAEDAAFTFLYPHLVQGWRAQGATLVPFSPLADEGPASDCDACWLPGGYPELHAGRLAAATRSKTTLAAFAQTRPVHGECGGYMVLGQGLVDGDGTRHAMTGLLGHATSFADRKLHLGYREARLLEPCALGGAGASVRGHEFHYARVIEEGNDAPLATLADGEGNTLGHAGARRGPVTGTFFHAIAAA
ncbi:cobyrinic acid a,c-diamide synthase [Methyloceanibacter methanicus]|uniref:Hydrogenobyrinate a,c-diamide synthase n=1 Tax=Methyloceanibacter methanicus TaxID=1774968 RepID=A0A1E3W5L3_9HYPH|nr:cobyrinate a,c-diamide synthase [Methyloceanibacter methanicus]ODS01108.1 cobyrinic acid a,c-diamide synthase [Methyloceanibacter methanicus]